MSYGLYISSEGAMAQEYKMQTIANNLANLETPGFKREVSLQIARHTESVIIGEVPFDTGLITDIGGGVYCGTHTEFKQGPISPTELDSDLAIEGDGWFRVRDVANGEEFLTRAGNFRIDRNGTFVTEWGRSRFQLLDTDGETITLPVPDSKTWKITDSTPTEKRSRCRCRIPKLGKSPTTVCCTKSESVGSNRLHWFSRMT